MKIIRIINSVRGILFINKLRVFLSLIGIAIGIAAVIILTAIGEGASNKLLSQIEMMGSNIITVDAGKIREVLGRKRQLSKVTTLKEKDCSAIIEECASEIIAAPTQDQTLTVKYANGTTKGRIIGTTPEYPAIRNFKIGKGRFFTEEENITSARVAIIGKKIVDNLFLGENPIGEYIRINNVPFEVIGLLEPKGSSYDGANEDEVVFIPLRAGMRRLFNVDYIKNIYVSVIDKNNLKTIEERINSVLRERHKLVSQDKEDDFTIQNMYAAMEAEVTTNNSFSLLVLSVSALSLLVGSVGILAVMLLSVKERTSEIGLRIAVGAKSKDILLQFLLEAVLLSCLGGILGVFGGIMVTIILNLFTDFNSQITLFSILISLIVSIILGIFSGVYPARRATLIQPIKALNN